MITGADTNNYRELLLSNRPLMDVRAPVEFAKGALPTAANLPLLTDSERQSVGTSYKKEGPEAAIARGHQLVSGKIKAQRLEAWLTFAQQNPDGYLYCFRGGMRSQLVQQWMAEAGTPYPRVVGGFKAMRHFLLEELNIVLKKSNVALISGMTGSGKTIVINSIPRALDLEALANHRGSTFGQLLEAQPSQIQFENTMSIALIRMMQGSNSRLYLEDESRLIGRCFLPTELQALMKAAPVIIVEESLDSRIDIVVSDYVIDLGERFEQAFGEQGSAKHLQKLTDDLFKIRKRLGNERHQDCEKAIAQAFTVQRETGDLSSHRIWINQLLSGYYDPMYSYQLERRSGNVLFRGSRDEVISFIQEQEA